MAKLNNALKRKANKLIEEMSAKMYSTADDMSDRPMKENSIYYPSLHLSLEKFEEQLKGVEVGGTVKIVGVGRLASKSENKEGGGHIGIEVEKLVIVSGKEENEDGEDS